MAYMIPPSGQISGSCRGGAWEETCNERARHGQKPASPSSPISAELHPPSQPCAREAWERRTSRQRCTAAPAEPGSGQWSLTVVMAAAPARVPNDVAGGDMFCLWSRRPAVVAFSSLNWGN
ncbi:hypothetical protein CPLU01_02135 [Colletotrichum plurivorum]|uniref:Uncharacterized protein n=1 Tax=Colletotrichum plurivorum TaxID=2175906 RepID=A0A8H6NN91_9PEZI|nr:hypothetical protein CPLU01_02135 [Colletotrichum plurivorum]